MKIEHNAKKGIWRTKDGRNIPIKGMDDKHLKNTVIFLIKYSMEDGAKAKDFYRTATPPDGIWL